MDSKIADDLNSEITNLLKVFFKKHFHQKGARK